MGGINCGNSNGNVIKLTEYRLNYANYIKYYFEGIKNFYEANISVENFTILELSSTEEAISEYKKVILLLDNSEKSLKKAIDYLNKCLKELEPLFKYEKIKNAFVEKYSSINNNYNKSIWEKNNLITNENKVWNAVIKSLSSGGEVKYFKYQIEEIYVLVDLISNLKKEYEKIEKEIRQGISYVKIRDIEFDITPYTAQILTKINDLSSSLTYLCLLEYSTHISISGKNLLPEDFLIKSTKKENINIV